jgi:hypothetical protein
LEEGPALAEPPSAVVEFATIVVVVVDVDADDAVAPAAAGRAVNVEARLGIRPGDSEDKDFWGRGESR